MDNVDQLWSTLYDSSATDFLGLRTTRKILDLGCGSGMWTWTLGRLTRGRGLMVGIDVDVELLRHAIKRLDGKAEFIAADAASLPFRPDCFDLTTCRRLLINLQGRNRRQVVKEMIRVTRMGGKVASVEPSLHTNKANQFCTICGSQRFSRQLEKANPGTDFSFGPKAAALFHGCGLENVGVWSYVSIDSTLPPYGRCGKTTRFVNPVVHDGTFSHALTTVSHPFTGRVKESLSRQASKLDSDMRRQVEKGRFVSVSAVPFFLTRGTRAPGRQH
jgi:SAM-dependent methyltransferase